MLLIQGYTHFLVELGEGCSERERNNITTHHSLGVTGYDPHPR